MRAQENEIFGRWRNALPEDLRGNFVPDGVVDDEKGNQNAYVRSNPKILLLLKEVNDPGPDGGGWDLREFLLQHGGRRQTWDNATRWLRGIRNLPNIMPWDQLEIVTEEQRYAELQNIVAMNLKKTPGGDVVNRFDWWQSVMRDKCFIREQFNLYHADIIICCGFDVAEAFSYVFGGENGLPWRSTTRGVRYYEYEPGKFAISFSHPAVRASSNLVHYGLIDAVHEIFHNAAWMQPAN